VASIETLILEIIARDKNASAAFDNLRRSVDNTTGSVDKNTSSLDKNTQAQKSGMGAAIGLGTAFSAMLSPLAAAGSGAIAFAAVAAPSILKVKTALTGPGGLDAAWGTLDNRQRNMALGVQALGSRFKDLSTAMEPRTAQVFGTALGLVNSALGPFSQLAGNAGTALEQFLIQFAHQGGLNQFITFMAHEAGPAIKLLGTDITNIAHAVFALLESWGGVGLAELKLVTDVITGITASLSWLSQHAPGLTAAAISIGGIALALSKLGLLSGVLKLTGISLIAGQMAGFAAATRGATLAEKGLLAASTALDAITPFGWAVLAAAAVGALAFMLDKADKSTQDLINTTLKAQGFNTAGYAAAAGQLGEVTTAMSKQDTEMLRGRAGVNGLGTAYRDLTQEQAKLGEGIAQQNQLLTTLENEYGLTRVQAVALAKASGVQVDKNGQLVDGFKASVTQAQAFANANLKAQQPVMGLAAAVTALTAQLDKQVTVTLTLQGDELAWRSAMLAAKTQLDSNSAGLKGNSAAAIANKQAVLGTTQAAVAFAKEQLTSRNNLAGASSQIEAQIRFLQGLHDHTGFAAAEIRVLVGWLRQVKSEQATIKVSGSGSYSINIGGGNRIHGARGLFINQGTPGVDDQLAMLQRGELVVPTNLVRSGAVDHLRGTIPGFAAGGVVGSYQDGVPGLTGFLQRENTATLTAMGNAIAHAVLQALQAASQFGGAGPGGGAPSANAALARSMFPGENFPAWNYVAMRESGWNQFARNPSSGAYGIPQALPESKLPFAGQARGGSNPAAQISWMEGYMRARYGGAAGAAAHEASFNWYDQGGWLPPGLSMAYNGTGRPEPVGGAGGITINNLYVTTPDGPSLVRSLQDYAKKNGPIKLKTRG
jgi:hypothetical protein